MLEHAEAFEKNTGRIHEWVRDRKQPPAVALYLWGHFWRLNSGRSYNGGPLPLQYSEIESYMRLFNLKLSKWEIRAIKSMDGAYLNATTAEGGKAKAGG